MVSVLAIIQARISSSRLPAKAMLSLGGSPLLLRVIQAVQSSKIVNKLVVATSLNDEDKVIYNLCESYGVDCYRGSLDDVLERFHEAVIQYQKPECIIRVTADNPLISPKLLDFLYEHYLSSGVDYAFCEGVPYGASVEIFSFKALEIAFQLASSIDEREHVTPYIKKKLKVLNLKAPNKYFYPELRVTIDTLSDYVRMEIFYAHCIKLGIDPCLENFIKYCGFN